MPCIHSYLTLMTNVHLCITQMPHASETHWGAVWIFHYKDEVDHEIKQKAGKPVAECRYRQLPEHDDCTCFRR
jgi:hypothetical protein